MFYNVPPTATADLDDLDQKTRLFHDGLMDPPALDRLRVLHGSYEQREPGVRMIRLRTPAGALTPAQLRALAEISRRYGAMRVHITTRQEFQVHNLPAEVITEAMRAFLGVGLVSRGGGGGTVRNILVSPDAGVSLDEVFDPTPHAFALTSRLIADSTSWQLPRKFKIAFSASDGDSAYALFTDLGFIAHCRDGQRGFRVYVAGGAGNKPEIGHLLQDFVAEGDIYLVAESLKRLFSKYGDRENRQRARLRFLWKSLGEDEFRRLYAVEYEGLRAQGPEPLDLIPLPLPNPVALVTEKVETDAAFDLWRARFVLPQAQPGRFSVIVPVTMGDIGVGLLGRLAAFLEPLGEDTVRADFGQNLRLRHIPEDHLPLLWTLLRGADPLMSQPVVLGTAISCTGAETCKLGICRSKGALGAIIDNLANSSLPLDDLGSFRLNVSGCPNACGQHLMAELGLSGGASRKDGVLYGVYSVFVGGRSGVDAARFATAVGRVPAKAIAAFIRDLLEIWLSTKQAPETFGDWAMGEGAGDLARLIERHGVPPSPQEDPSFYRDWGLEEPFSIRKPT